MKTETFDHAPTSGQCEMCASTRFQDRGGWSICLGCGSRYATSASAAVIARSTEEPASISGPSEPQPMRPSDSSTRKPGPGRFVGALIIAVVLLLIVGGIYALVGWIRGEPSDADRLANVKSLVTDTVMGYGVRQAADPEVSGGTLEIQLAVAQLPERDGLAKGVCRDVATVIGKRRDGKAYPKEIQIYAINGDFWTRCDPNHPLG